jgi:hypothetical protein
MPPALLAFASFSVGTCVYTQASLDRGLPVYASCRAGMTGAHHHTQLLLVEMGVANILPGLISKCDLLNL